MKESPEKYARFSEAVLVLSAGMPRSGSTLLFNLLREILKRKWGSALRSGWIGDIETLTGGDAYLIKTHSPTPELAGPANHIFYSYRDVRTALVSNERKFGREANLERARFYIDQFCEARRLADLCVRYEELVAEPERFAASIAGILGIEIDPPEIVSRVLSLEPPPDGSAGYSKETLLHPGHQTHTGPDDWRSTLPGSLKDAINKEFAWWFRECGYPPD